MIQEDQGQCSSHQVINNFQTYQEHQLLLQQQIMSQQNSDIFGFNHHHHMFPGSEVPWSMPQVQPFNQASPYASFFNRSRVVPSSLQFTYNDHHHHQVQPGSSSSAPFGLQAEMGKMSAQEIMEAKALAASKSHSEAERRRRERINNHLAKLRSLLPSTTKTDKASLLAEVIQHVKELKRQTSLIAETSPVPTEADEITVDAADDEDNGKFVIKASLCCEDRTDILPELIKTLKALRLRTLKADITTLGGRMKNVLFITGDDNNEDSYSSRSCIISSIQEALKAVIEKSVGDESAASGNVKRQRTNIV